MAGGTMHDVSHTGDTQRKSQPAATTVVMVSESDHDPKPHTEPSVTAARSK
jgi:hypothetical protein